MHCNSKKYCGPTRHRIHHTDGEELKDDSLRVGMHVIEWLDENIGIQFEDWINGLNDEAIDIFFHTEDQAILFKLTWG